MFSMKFQFVISSLGKTNCFLLLSPCSLDASVYFFYQSMIVLHFFFNILHRCGCSCPIIRWTQVHVCFMYYIARERFFRKLHFDECSQALINQFAGIKGILRIKIHLFIRSDDRLYASVCTLFM